MVKDAADHSVSSVAGRDLAPDRSHLFAIGSVHTVDVSNTLSKVELRVSSGIHSIDLNESLVGVLEHLRSKLDQIKNLVPSVSHENSLDVQLRGLLRHRNLNAVSTHIQKESKTNMQMTPTPSHLLRAHSKNNTYTYSMR